MQTFLRRPGFAASRLSNRPGFTALAVLMLSLGVGATTALFTVTDGLRAQSEAGVRCETTMKLGGNAPAYAMVAMPKGVELRDRVSDAYEASVEGASDALDALPDVLPEALARVHPASAPGLRPLLALLGVLAIGFLLICARGASAMLTAPRASLVVLETTIGALVVATLSLRALGLPAIGARATAFALCISLVTVFFARIARKRGAPLTI